MRVSGFCTIDSLHVLPLVAVGQAVVGGAGDQVAVQGAGEVRGLDHHTGSGIDFHPDLAAGIERGQPTLEACQTALADVTALNDLPSAPVLHAIAINAHGHHAGITTSPQRSYLALEQGRSTYAAIECHTAT
jgi:hypothetical protein